MVLGNPANSKKHDFLCKHMDLAIEIHPLVGGC